ncbi:MAG: deoxyhypusine synthase [Candidatus Hydrothermarchaeota archaeon]
MKKIRQVELKDVKTVGDLLKEFSSAAFNAGRLSLALDVLEEMVSNERCTLFLGLAGAMVPAGLRYVISDMIKDGFLDVLVTTGANITHDLVEAFGGSHYKENNSKSYELMDRGDRVRDKRIKDIKLRDEKISRIYDSYIDDESFIKLEKGIYQLLTDLPEEKRESISISDLLYEIGLRLKDERSILRQASIRRVPVFVPAFIDSILGLHTWFFSQENEISLNILEDISKILDIVFESESNGVLIVGGGVPKNFILQSMLMSQKGFEFAIQIRADRPEYGGLSGASLEEAISWGKINKDAKIVDLVGDATILLPILISSLRERLNK